LVGKKQLLAKGSWVLGVGHQAVGKRERRREQPLQERGVGFARLALNHTLFEEVNFAPQRRFMSGGRHFLRLRHRASIN
jgi:hypothetical protein